MSKDLGSQHPLTLSAITPPNSFRDSSLPSSTTSSPPTGPKTLLRNWKISRIINLIQDVRSGRPRCQLWLAFFLAPNDFQTLLTEIKVDDSLRSYFEEKLRYDYFAHRNLFILRMPTSTHEYITAGVVSEIEKQLQTIVSDADLKHLGSPRLELVVEDSGDGDGGKDAHTQGSDRHARESSTIATYDIHEPDAAFGYRKDKYPGVVLEVAYSQKKKDLKDLAERYILGSDGNIRIVIGLCLDYQQKEKATISIWRPEIVIDDRSEHLECVQKVAEREFRNENSQAVRDPQAGLELFLQDFATTTRNIPINNSNRIYIPSSRLCDIVTEAITSKTGQSTIQTPGYMISLPPGTRKRKRVKTPPEELALEDEQEYADAEESDAKRIEMDVGGEYRE